MTHANSSVTLTTYKILKKQKPEIKNINEPGGSPNPRFKGIEFKVPAKLVHNSSDMELLNLYTKGALRFEDTGRTCGNCINFYYDPTSKYGGRCKARGYMTTHEDTPADETHNWVHPVEQANFPVWPACPYFLMKDRLSRRQMNHKTEQKRAPPASL